MAIEIRTLRVEAALDAQAYVAGGNAKAATDEKMIATGNRLAGTLEQTDRRLGNTGTAAQRLARSLDPAYAASQKLEAGQRTLQRALDSGNISADRHAQLMTLLHQRYSGLSAPINDNTRLMGASTAATRNMQFAMTNLSFQVNDVVSGLISGQQPLRILAQQGGQIFQIFQQGGAGFFSQVGNTLRGWVTPTTVAVGGLAAVAVGMGVLIARSAETSGSIRTFNVLLRGMGAESLASAENLEAAAKRMRDVGLSASEARAGILAVARAGLNPAAAPRIVAAGQDLVPVLGDNATQTLTTALSGGLESTIKLGQAIHALSTEEIANYREMARHGEAAHALDQAFGRIEAAVKGLHNEALNPAARAMRDLRVAWNDMIDALSNNTAITTVTKGLAELARIIGALASGNLRLNLALDLGPFGRYQIAGQAPPAASAAIPSISGATEAELAMLAEIRRRESGGRYDTFHATGARVGSLADVEALRGPSHAFGAYGFQPGTYRSMAAQTGLYDLSQQSQDLNALALLRRYGPNSTASWAASGPYNAASLSAPSITRADDPERQAAAIDKLVEARKREVEVLKNVGEAAEVVRARQEAETFNSDNFITGKEAERNVLNAVTAARAKVGIEQDKAIRAGQLELSGTNAIARGYQESARAGMVAEAAARALTEAYERYGDVADLDIKATARFNQILAQQTSAQQIRNAQEMSSQRDTQAALQLQISLTGQNSDEINKQLTLLRAKQQIEEQFPLLSQREKEARIATVAATADLTQALNEARAAQQRLDEGVRSIANTISNTLTRSIEDAFSGNRVESWGARMRSILSGLLSQIAQFAFIRPAIGTVLSGLGLGSAAQSFGTFGNLFGGSSGTGTSGGGLDASTLLQGGGVLKDIFGLDLGWGGGSWFGNIGQSLGFGYTDAALANLIGIESSYVFPGSSSLFGGTTLGSALGGIGAGFGAGTLLNSLIGGNTFGGTIGSGLGSIGGFLLGGPIGGLLGGLLGGPLGGLFGNSRPSNFASGGLLTLGAGGGAITGVNSSGNAQNDQISNQILTSVQQFTRGLLQALPGSSIAGNIYTNIGSRDGLIVGGSIGGLSGELKFGSAQEAVNAISLQVARSLEGVSAAFKQAIGTITDSSEIQSLVQFIAVYDNLKTAADSAFSSIAADTQKIGPFKQALDQISSIFDELTIKTEQYGLSLAPVVAAEAEAMRRLVDDHNKTIADAILGITDPFKLALDQVKAANKAILDDAIATGANRVQAERLTALTLDQLWKSQTASLLQLKEQLTTGGLSGLTGAAAVTAANDNFRRELRLVQGGNLSEIANLATAGQNAIALSTQAYGNAPQTAALRAAILVAIESVLSRRSFAAGTDYTPPGWVQVHRDEWMYQRGGATVLPRGASPTMGVSNDEVVKLLREVIARLDGLIRVDQLHGSISERGFGQVVGALDRKPLIETPRQRVA